MTKCEDNNRMATNHNVGFILANNRFKITLTKKSVPGVYQELYPLVLSMFNWFYLCISMCFYINIWHRQSVCARLHLTSVYGVAKYSLINNTGTMNRQRLAPAIGLWRTKGGFRVLAITDTLYLKDGMGPNYRISRPCKKLPFLQIHIWYFRFYLHCFNPNKRTYNFTNTGVSDASFTYGWTHIQ